MKQITKGSEPPSLRAFHQTPGCAYEGYTDKEALRNALVAEQKGICCYCMGALTTRIGHMKVEHWHCQSQYPGEQLKYANMLGACTGGQGAPPELQHCDTKKGNLDLKWNPSNPAHHIESRICYLSDGEIRSDDPEFDHQLDEVLNLNMPILRQNRKRALDAVLEWWKHGKAIAKGPIPSATVENKKRAFAEKSPLSPFSHVAVWWLQQKLDRRTK